MPGLSDKVALVTGGSRGIGAAISRRLAEKGATIVLNYAHNEDAAKKTKAEVEKTGRKVLLAPGDLGDPRALKDVFEKAAAQFGRLDILVNNAGVFDPRPLSEIDAELFDRLFSINVRPVALGMSEAGRRMRDGGRIINISSVAARLTRPGGAIYSATKAAVEALTRVAAAELGPRGITVNAVAPGFTETDMMNEFLAETAAAKEDIIESTPLRRVGAPEDIADVVAFLASDDARWITGQVIAVSGGR